MCAKRSLYVRRKSISTALLLICMYNTSILRCCALNVLCLLFALERFFQKGERTQFVPPKKVPKTVGQTKTLLREESSALRRSNSTRMTDSDDASELVRKFAQSSVTSSLTKSLHLEAAVCRELC
jgi:hypothetical protein